jgi:hypothetical protein
VILLLFFWVTARVKEFDCSSLSQWQIPSRLLDSELHRFFFLTARSSRKCGSIHFLSLSAVSITIAASMIVLEESQTLHQVATGSIAGKFATFSLNFSLNPRLCSAVQSSQHTSVLHPSKSNQFHSSWCVDAAPLPPIPVLEAQTSARLINCSVFGFQLCYPCFQDCYCRSPFVHCLIIGFCSVKSHELSSNNWRIYSFSFNHMVLQSNIVLS